MEEAQSVLISRLLFLESNGTLRYARDGPSFLSGCSGSLHGVISHCHLTVCDGAACQLRYQASAAAQIFWRHPTKPPIVKAYRKIQAYRELGCSRRPFATTLDESSPPPPARYLLASQPQTRVPPDPDKSTETENSASSRATATMPGAVDDTVMEDVPQVEGSEQGGEEEVAPRVRIVRTLRPRQLPQHREAC